MKRVKVECRSCERNCVIETDEDHSHTLDTCVNSNMSVVWFEVKSKTHPLIENLRNSLEVLEEMDMIDIFVHHCKNDIDRLLEIINDVKVLE